MGCWRSSQWRAMKRAAPHEKMNAWLPYTALCTGDVKVPVRAPIERRDARVRERPKEMLPGTRSAQRSPRIQFMAMARIKLQAVLEEEDKLGRFVNRLSQQARAYARGGALP